MRTTPAPYEVTAEIAGVVFRLASTHGKPIHWVRALHPAFLSSRAPEIDVTFVYDDAYWCGEPPWVGVDAVDDTPRLRRDGTGLAVESAYYTARVDAGRRTIEVRIAAGFRVDGVMRMLVALVLEPRGGVLVRGRFIAAQGALIAGDDLPETKASGAGRSGLGPSVALASFDNGIGAYATPFGADAAPATGNGPVPVRTIHVPAADRATGAQSRSTARAVAMLIPYVTVIGTDAAALEATIASVARLLQSVACVGVRVNADAVEDRPAARVG